jgi:hypothetical protein
VTSDIHLEPRYLPLYGLKAGVPRSQDRESKPMSASNISGSYIANEPATDQNQRQ